MGQSLVRALRQAPPDGVIAAPAELLGSLPQPLALTGALASAGSARLGLDAVTEGAPSGVKITADPRVALERAAVAIDFSAPERLAEHAQACVDMAVPLLVGTTGFDAAGRSALDSASQRIAVLVAPNTSLGIGVLRQLVVIAAAALGGGFDVEISEAHHRLKRDAPSGTALALGEAAAEARNRRLAELAVFERHGVSAARTPGSIGFSVVRAGDIVGEHTVTFAAAGERLELTHRATDRIVFARGALQAAGWLVGRPVGLYGMRDVLGL
jgi:4-hydroxy-tetrahydrodipicolinate reductase